jgi:NAD(P)H-nitrite reductase large subunit
MPSHVIIGGGPAATNAIETIRQLEPAQSQITLICDEPAHSRMALPYWISGQIPREQTHTGDAAYFTKLNVDTRFGRRVTGLDTGGKQATLDNDDTLSFDNLLIATGSSPMKLAIPGSDLPGVQPMWTLDHAAQALQRMQDKKHPRVVLVGAGFIGFIVLNAMFKRGWQLAVVEREAQVLPRMLDLESATHVEQWLGQRGVQLHTKNTVKEISEAGDGTKNVVLSSGKTLTADLVVLATGIRANTDLASAAGIKVDQGILVDPRMQTSAAGVYAAGDVAQGPVLFSDKPEIHAIQPTAVDHGRIAGANMAGQAIDYPGSLLMNVVDVCGLQTASFGRWDDASAEAMIIDNARGRVYRKLLWQEDQIVGAIFVGRPNDMGMLTDVGMVKGILQTQTRLGPWKQHLADNPFDVRRAYIAAGVGQKLVGATLLGRPTRPRGFQFGNPEKSTTMGADHAAYVGTKQS